MAQFGSQDPISVQFDLATDPTGNKSYPLWRAPVGATVTGLSVVTSVSHAAGSAVALRLVNFGTAGTALKATGGTVTAALGGTAAAGRLSANVPAYTDVTVNPYIAPGEWLALQLTEEGSGWAIGEAIRVMVDVIPGQMGTNAE